MTEDTTSGEAGLPKPPGQMITLYSYRGGTGRSIAAASLATILASKAKGGRGVLVIDADISAPSQQYLFDSYLSAKAPFIHNPGRAADSADGLVELLQEITAFDSRSYPFALTDEEAQATIDKVGLDRFIIKTDIEGLSLMKAGRFDSGYTRRASDVSRSDILDSAGRVLRALSRKLASMYDYVVIDSASGLGRMAWLSASALPDVLILLLGMNGSDQVDGLNVAQNALDVRARGQRPLRIYPVPARVDVTHPELHQRHRLGENGYQRRLEQFLADGYGCQGINLQHYFDAVLFEETADYQVGDDVPALCERAESQSNLLKAYQNLAELIASGTKPWEVTGAVQ